MKTLVMKFGGASVASPDHFSHIADLIIERQNHFARLVIVVSAMGQTTNQLIELANRVHPNPPQREYDMLISAGERISMSLLAMALCRKGREAVSFTGSQSGILTCAQHTNAQIIDVRPHRLTQTLEQGKIVIVAGFQGVSLHKEITTLGRGGSDTSAVALGVALGAEEIEFFKDVPGVFDRDPKCHKDAILYSHLSYQDALEIVSQGAKILHPRAIRLAAKNALPLHVRSFMCSYEDNPGTRIADAARERSQTPLYELA
ncbi:Aspartokinase [Candidatus Protochlamydia naegleriophila]|uniref:Aspartokinase n=1 Tax=Candidatus Protochlamydia naegleriophila TaxID=389348 RepID=A0A0U5JCY6_9BACT|nr:aspartate kinase [Candidatus Protochlamydia naegleriophila]CUI16973.1 Aspartokinase [Candidatus Protochlamydia naegleriophila]